MISNNLLLVRSFITQYTLACLSALSIRPNIQITELAFPIALLSSISILDLPSSASSKPNSIKDHNE